MLQRRTRAGVVGLLLALTGCGQATAGTPTPPASTPTAGAVDTPPAPVGPPRAVPAFDHIVVVVLENAAAGAVEADASFRRLADQGALMTRSYAVAHHSLPNYVALTSGAAPTDVTRADCPAFDCAVTGPNLADQLNAAGISWGGYFGGSTTPCLTPSPGSEDTFVRGYLTHHNPFVYFPSVGGGPQGGTDQCRQHLLGLDRLVTGLRSGNVPRYAFVAPDSCDDGHDRPCADGRPGGLPTSMPWITGFWKELRASPAWTPRSLLVVTFDEGADGDNAGCCGKPGGGRVATLLLGGMVTPGSRSGVPRDHYATLRTVEDAFTLAPLGLAAGAVPINDVFSG